jgi:hypothetical protein
MPWPDRPPAELVMSGRGSASAAGFAQDSQLEDGGGGQAVHEVCTQILGEDRRLVLPDRLVQACCRQDDVAGRPHDRTERRAVS